MLSVRRLYFILANVAAPPVLAMVACHTKIAVASKTSILIIHSKTGKILMELKTKKNCDINAVSISTCGCFLATGDEKGQVVVRVIEALNPEQQQKKKFQSYVLFSVYHGLVEPQSPNPIKCVTFSPGIIQLAGKNTNAASKTTEEVPGTSKGMALLASSDASNKIVLRLLTKPNVELYTFNTAQTLISLMFVPECSPPKLCAADSYDRVIFYSDINKDGKWTNAGAEWEFTNSGTVECIDFSKDGKIALIGVTKKLLVLNVDGSGTPFYTRGRFIICFFKP